MKSLKGVNAIEASISVDESDGSYLLELKFEFSDGTTAEMVKKLSQPAFRLELYKEGDPSKAN